MSDRGTVSDGQSRELILGRVGTALKNAVSFKESAACGVASPGGPGTPDFHQYGLDISDIDLFEETVSDYKATVRRVASVSLPEVVAELVGSWKLNSLVVPAGLDRNLVGLVNADVQLFVDDGSMQLAEISKIEGVITGSTCAIAETGTIVLSGQPDEGRRAITLLPDFHIAVVASNSIVREVRSLFQRVGVANPVTLISGPSATSDIELSRVEGVHGPRNLAVLIVTE